MIVIRERKLFACLCALVLSLSFGLFPYLSSAEETPAAGKQLFERRCTGCHALDRHKEGPSLGRVFGRRAGQAPGFRYSDALRAANFVWDEQKLNQWLTDTQSVVEDNNMDFHVPSAAERTEIIRYLKAISAGRK